jgi:hypothetical protein
VEVKREERDNDAIELFIKELGWLIYDRQK